MEQINYLVIVLNQAISPDSILRNQALQILSQAFQNQGTFQHLFQLMNEQSINVNDKLVAAIYLQNWIKDNYKLLDDISFQSMLREQIMDLFLKQTPSIPLTPYQYQLSKSLEKIATCDFPTNTQIIENLRQNSELTYIVLKSIVRNKLQFHRPKVEFLFEKYLNLQTDEIFLQIQAILCNSSNLEEAVNRMRIPLKLKLLECKVLQDRKSSVMCFIRYIEFFMQLSNHECALKIIYLCQKCIIRTLTYQNVLFYIFQNYNKTIIKQVEDKDCSYILMFIKKYYFEQQFKVPRIQNIENYNNLLQILQSSDYERQRQEKHLRLVFQIVQLINQILDKYSYNPLNISDDIEGLGIGDTLAIGGSQILENAFYEGYFEQTLQYLFNNAMQLSLVQLYHIYFQPEKSFTEEAEDSIVYDIRESGQELIKTCFINMKADYITDLLKKQLSIFKQTPLIRMANYNPSNQNIQFTNYDSNTLLACIMQRETFYATLVSLFKLTKEEIDFEEWFQQYLCYELMDSNPLFLPLKIQILSLIHSYLQSQQQISLELLNSIQIHCFQLIQSNEVISIKLGAIRCLSAITETIGEELKFQFQQLTGVLKNLFLECKQVNSKLVLMDFAVLLIGIDALDFGWTLKTIISEWQNTTLVNDKAQKEDPLRLTLRGKTLQVISQLIRNCSSDVWFSAMELFLNICIETLKQDQDETLKEIYETENGLNLFLNLLSQLSQQRNINALKFLQNMSKEQSQIFRAKIVQIQSFITEIMLSNINLWNNCVIALDFIIILGLGGDQELSKTLIECTIKMYDEINWKGFSKFLFSTELYILSKAPLVDQTMSIIIPYLVNKIDYQTQQGELIAICNLISTLSYSKSQLMEQFIYQSWFQPLIQMTYNVLMSELPIRPHEMGMFFLMCVNLIMNDTYVLSQLKIQQDSFNISDMIIDLFDQLQQYFIKSLVAPQNYIGFQIREAIQINQDDTQLRGLQTPDITNIHDYKITYQLIKSAFLQIVQLYANHPKLRSIQEFL